MHIISYLLTHPVCLEHLLSFSHSPNLLQLVWVLDQVWLQLQGKKVPASLRVNHRIQVFRCLQKDVDFWLSLWVSYEFLFSMWIPVHLQGFQFAFSFVYIHLSFPTAGLADLSQLRLIFMFADSSISFHIAWGPPLIATPYSMSLTEVGFCDQVLTVTEMFLGMLRLICELR